MKTILIAASLAALTTLAAPVLAQTPSAAAKQDRRAQPMTRAQVQADVQARFAAVDANRDGAVTKAEFDAHRAKKQADRAEQRGARRDARFAMLDTNKDGQISKAEYAATPQRGPDGAKGMRGHRGPGGGMRGHGGGMAGGRDGGWGGGRDADSYFAAMDANRDGRVTLAEASAKPLAMFDKADTDRNGTVTPEERRAARAAMRAEWQAKRG